MRNVYLVNNYFIHNDNIHFKIDEEREFVPASQVIVDSDALAFVYIVEENDQYSYLSFPQQVWPQLVQLLTEGKDPVLVSGEQEFVLSSFAEELEYLVYNIEGNGNYGEPFVTAVEQTFSSILQEQ